MGRHDLIDEGCGDSAEKEGQEKGRASDLQARVVDIARFRG
jgi:hypothetical protein